MTVVTPAEAAQAIQASADLVRDEINELAQRVFRTRGGRLGSGMGLLLEGLWGYYTTSQLEPLGLELAWIADHRYNDFSCIDLETEAEWDPSTGEGELLRVEAKSMNLGADESKAHFDEPSDNIGVDDLLAVITWKWAEHGGRVWPRVTEIFVDRAAPIAALRDVLHLARGGTFVDRYSCPDGCVPDLCQHHGEPLNANDKRERPQGPEATRVSAKVSAAQNFGGLVRMLKARGGEAKEARIAEFERNPIARTYNDFIERALGGDVDEATLE